jgi:3-isopropylmalate/(R)-2-methylmalate dehydratase large subunit
MAQQHAAKRLFDKVWAAHIVVAREDGADLLYVDRHLVHEGGFHGFNALRAKNARISRPDLTFGVVDHYAPTRTHDLTAVDPAIAGMIHQHEANCAEFGVRCIGLTSARQGIVHVVGPEQGLTLPGALIVCGDSHTSTHGALGAIAFGIGASEVAHVMITQTLWQKRPRAMRVTFDGQLAPGVGAKDMALTMIAAIGADGGQGFAIEYSGSAVRDLSVEGRLTLCNMSIESGARCGIVAPNQRTIDYLRGRPAAPQGDMFDHAAMEWLGLASDSDAEYDHEVTINGDQIAPIVTWGISPEDAVPVTATVPLPSATDAARAAHVREAAEYMGLTPGMKISDIRVDQVFIGSCTNSRIEDLRAAAAILLGRRAVVPGMVSPGSALVRVQAEQEGLDRIFIDAGLDWVASGCSMCVGMNGDLVPAGRRCASTTNRNFKGRQGPGARTHLMSPAMVAAAAVTGHITDVRALMKGRQS